MSEPEPGRMIEADPGRNGDTGRQPEPGRKDPARKQRAGRAWNDDDGAPPEAIVAIPLRHPWRNVVAVLLIIGLAVFVLDAAQRPDYGWADVGKYIFDRRISQAAWVTLWLTIYAMIGAIVIGLLLAIMRLSPNPVLKSIAWLYIWIFRGTPVYVQLVFWGIVALIYPVFTLGIPFMDPWVTIPNEVFTNLFITAVIGLALNEAAYMSEIVRAGLLSVDEGQAEASTALAMSWGQTMRYVVVPQAMKIIIPPTGNEVISMLKTTSLVAAIPLSVDLYGVSRGISAVTFTPVPLLIVASLWYLLFTSVLMVGQHFIEKRFSRGTGRAKTGKGSTTAGAAPAAVPGAPGAPGVPGGPLGNDFGGKG